MTTTTTPELLHLDPTTIEIGENVRLGAWVSKGFSGFGVRGSGSRGCGQIAEVAVEWL